MRTSSLVFLLVLFIFSFSCSKDKDSQDDTSATQDVNEVFSSEHTAQIIEEGDKIIDDAIALAFSGDSNVDLEGIKAKIENLEGVKSASISPKGSAVLINEENGAVLNLLIYSKSDSRFIQEESISSKSLNTSIQFPPVVASSSGTGKALILAPYQNEFEEDIPEIAQRLIEANYELDIYLNEDADLDKFRSSFLTNYDIVYISSHGFDNAGVNGTEQLGRNASIAVGEDTPLGNKNKYLGLSTLERTGTTNFSTSLGVTPHWFDVTSDGNFSNTWVFINACHSASFSAGPKSFSQAFFNLGAAAFNGFSDFIYVPLGSAISEKAVVTFTSGYSFTEMNESVINDDGLSVLSTKLRLNPNNNQQFSSVDLFSASKNITDPFYLILAEDLIGSATLSPDSGPVDTMVLFEVVIKPQFINVVADVTFEIDNTQQFDLPMEKVNDSTWQSEKTAPDDIYPRIDTFTFTAVDSEDNILGKGSAAFSFTKATSGKTRKNPNLKWTN